MKDVASIEARVLPRPIFFTIQHWTGMLWCYAMGLTQDSAWSHSSNQIIPHWWRWSRPRTYRACCYAARPLQAAAWYLFEFAELFTSNVVVLTALRAKEQKP